MINPLVSVIVPCYNQALYLSEALQSVLDQTYTNWECIIVNDGSPDNTEEVAKEWLAKDLRFKYIYKENGGLSSARNAGITMANGEYILPLDADDRIGNQYLKLAIQAFELDHTLKLVYCRAEKFGEETGEWILPEFSIQKLATSNMIFCSGIYRKSEWERVGGYDVKMIYGYEDWEFWIAILKIGGTVKRIEDFCFYYRIKKVSMIKNICDEKFNNSNVYVNEKHTSFFISQLGTFENLIGENYRIKKEIEFLKKEIKHLTKYNVANVTFRTLVNTILRRIKRKLWN